MLLHYSCLSPRWFCHSLLHPYWYSHNADMKTGCQSKLINIKALFELTISSWKMTRYFPHGKWHAVYVCHQSSASLRQGWWTTWSQLFVVFRKRGDLLSFGVEWGGWNLPCCFASLRGNQRNPVLSILTYRDEENKAIGKPDLCCLFIWWK